MPKTKESPIRAMTQHWLDCGVHIIEFFIAAVVLLFAAILSGHLLLNLWHVLHLFGNAGIPLNIRTAVTEAMDILIMLELAQVFIRLEAKQQIGVSLLLDTAILFSVRETILQLYGVQSHLQMTELSVAVFVVLRILYSWRKPVKDLKRSHESESHQTEHGTGEPERSGSISL